MTRPFWRQTRLAHFPLEQVKMRRRKEEAGRRKRARKERKYQRAKQSDHLGVGDSVGDVEDDRLLLLPHLPDRTPALLSSLELVLSTSRELGK
jgi:hypothetical protein